MGGQGGQAGGRGRGGRQLTVLLTVLLLCKEGAGGSGRGREGDWGGGPRAGVVRAGRQSMWFWWPVCGCSRGTWS